MPVEEKPLEQAKSNVVNPSSKVSSPQTNSTEGLFTLKKQNQLDLLRKQVLEKSDKSENSTESSLDTIPVEGQEAFTIEEFEKVFNEYIQELERTAKSRISSFLKQCRITLLQDSKVELELRSKLELELLEEEKLDMIPFFRSRLKNGKFDFEYIINSDLIQSGKKVSKQDVLKNMNDKNPLLSDFITQLGFEIEY